AVNVAATLIGAGVAKILLPWSVTSSFGQVASKTVAANAVFMAATVLFRDLGLSALLSLAAGSTTANVAGLAVANRLLRQPLFGSNLGGIVAMALVSGLITLATARVMNV